MTAISERASHSLTLRGADRTVMTVTCLQLSSGRHSAQGFLVPATSIDLTWPSAAPRLALKSGNGRGPWVRHGVQWGGAELGDGTCPPYMSWSHFLPSRQQAGKEKCTQSRQRSPVSQLFSSEKPHGSPPYCLCDLMSWVSQGPALDLHCLYQYLI